MTTYPKFHQLGDSKNNKLRQKKLLVPELL